MGFASLGTQMVALTLWILAARAMDWPWLPVLAVMTPLVRSSGVSWAMRFRPPRILNAPVGLWFSCLMCASAWSRSFSRG